ncbi:MAG: ribosome silencing factor [Candidatus Omnitrophica bacterium]|nr:ribosome silencing factor [Candidatus Omnitrophota bacterium]
MVSPKKNIELIAKAALAKKANDVVLIDLRGLPTLCDYFIVASGESTTQIDSIADNIEKAMHLSGHKLINKEGKKEALWILLDYGDIVVHVFYKDARGFYNLEKLWHDAPQERISEERFKKRSTPSRRKKKKRLRD